MDIYTGNWSAFGVVRARRPGLSSALTEDLHGCQRCQAYKPPDSRNLALPAPACAQPGGLVSMGAGGDRARPARGQADFPLRGLQHLLLVPCHGAAVFRE